MTAHSKTAPTREEEPMDSLRNFATGWDRFWFSPSDPTTLGLIRLVAGVVILYSYFCYSFDLLSYVSPKEAWLDAEVTTYLRKETPTYTFPNDWPRQGWYNLTDKALDDLSANGVPQSVLVKLVPLREQELEKIDFLNALTRVLDQNELARYLNTILAHSPGRNNVPNQIEVSRGQNSWSIFFHLERPEWIWTAHILVLIVLLLFTAGFATRMTSVIASLGAISYIWRAQTSLFGMDAIIVILMTYLMIAPAGAALSLDRWLHVRRERKRLRDPNAVVPLEPLASATFATRMMQIHFCIIYLAAGTSKLLGPAWWNGNALWGCYANYSFAPLRIPAYREFIVFLCQHRWLWEMFMSGGAVFTLFMELGFPFLVWNKQLRWLMLCGSVMLHTGIGLFMGLTTFSLLMLCLVLSFVPPEASRLFLEHVTENGRRLLRIVTGKAASAAKPLPEPARSVGDDIERFFESVAELYSMRPELIPVGGRGFAPLSPGRGASSGASLRSAPATHRSRFRTLRVRVKRSCRGNNLCKAFRKREDPADRTIGTRTAIFWEHWIDLSHNPLHVILEACILNYRPKYPTSPKSPTERRLHTRQFLGTTHDGRSLICRLLYASTARLMSERVGDGRVARQVAMTGFRHGRPGGGVADGTTGTTFRGCPEREKLATDKHR